MTTELSKAMADFAVVLYNTATASDNKNAFMSPMSISMALAMTYAGAGANTKTELHRVLFGEHLTKNDDEKIHAGFGHMLESLNLENSPCKLQLANRAYAADDLMRNVSSTFSGIIGKQYRSEFEPTNFSDEPAARTKINNYVSKQTNEKITELIPAGLLNSLTKLVLVNAIYFKGNWLTQFDQKRTGTGVPFSSAEDHETKVDMMIMHKQHFLHFQNDKCQVLGMPYAGNELFFYAVLPNQRCGLAALQKQLTGACLLELFGSCTDKKVDRVGIPKFKLEIPLNLNKTLQTLGVKDLFDEQAADLSNITGHPGLFVSDVLHKAFVEVNEEGTEAAAATAVVMQARCMPIYDVDFWANHPFLFAIVHKPSMSILFMGRYTGV